MARTWDLQMIEDGFGIKRFGMNLLKTTEKDELQDEERLKRTLFFL